MRRCSHEFCFAGLVISCHLLREHHHVGAFTHPSSSLGHRRTFNPPTIASNGCSVTDINIITRTASTILPPRNASPSGIDEWSQLSQAAVFFGTYASLALATYPCTKLLETLSQSVIGLERWRIYVIDSTLPILLGTFFFVAGMGHFLAGEAFREIYPPPGTWGIWYVPGSAAFHVAWTGVVEILGGAGLLFGGIRDAFGLSEEEEEEGNLIYNFLKPISASILFLLTLLVTPANIYMFTHGAVMGDNMAPLGMSFHVVRFAIQVQFLTLLLTLARDGFFFAWGDELD
mmetsp:Transcript_44141/g.92819  ORF Transcript_44141/g.92819 Transcript_44141/m.92819 type:complete len:288 (-) Transcript_44141:349-1212(-)